LGRLPHKCKKYCSLNILEAPFVVKEEDRMGTIEGEPKTWFYRNKETLVVDLASLEETMSFVQQEWDSASASGEPYNGILGFSQGGTLTGMICQYPERFPGIEAVICIGSPDNALIEKVNIAKYTGLKALHLAGATDSIVPTESSKNLSEKFNEDTTDFQMHEQGHCIPSRAEQQKVIVDFIAEVASGSI